MAYSITHKTSMNSGLIIVKHYCVCVWVGVRGCVRDEYLSLVLQMKMIFIALHELAQLGPKLNNIGNLNNTTPPHITYPMPYWQISHNYIGRIRVLCLQLKRNSSHPNS